MKALLSLFACLCLTHLALGQSFPVRARVDSVAIDRLSFVATHEAIPGFMEAMTMPFDVSSSEELDGIEAGDKIAFEFVVGERESFARTVRVLADEALLNLPHADGLGADHAAHAHRHQGARAPAGVMGDHRHHAGGSMVSYRFMSMSMGGLYEGTDELAASELFSRGYGVAPESMTMDMHMFGAMYAPSEDLTFMAMANYLENEMVGVTKMGERFTTTSEGWGDASVNALLRIRRLDTSNVHFGLGLGLPLGSSSVEHQNVPMENKHLPYAMQLGSGTFDVRPSVTWNDSSGAWAWGGQASAIARIGRNDDGYRLGNRAGATFWLSRAAGHFRISTRLSADHWGNVSGRDADLSPMAPMMNAAADPRKQGGSVAALHLGLETQVSIWKDRPVRVALEWGKPLYQDLDGPQMGRESQLAMTFNNSF